MAEKPIAASQGRSYALDEIHPTRLAKVLSKAVTKTPHGIGLGIPETMQLAIDEAGAPRIVAAAAVSAAGKVVGKRGLFYKVAGADVEAIDGPTWNTLPPHNTHAKLGPADPDGVAAHLADVLSEAVGGRVEFVVIDANDLTAAVLGASPGADRALAKRLMRDNPLGQGHEQTPVCVLRPLGPLPAAELARQRRAALLRNRGRGRTRATSIRRMLRSWCSRRGCRRRSPRQTSTARSWSSLSPTRDHGCEEPCTTSDGGQAEASLDDGACSVRRSWRHGQDRRWRRWRRARLPAIAGTRSATCAETPAAAAANVACAGHDRVATKPPAARVPLHVGDELRCGCTVAAAQIRLCDARSLIARPQAASASLQFLTAHAPACEAGRTMLRSDCAAEARPAVAGRA